MIEKSLYDISWQVPESEYRADPAISYSTMAKYAREGFSKLSSLFDRVDTPSLTNGSAVDAIITGGQEEFDSRFFVADIGDVTDAVMKVCQYIKNNLPENTTISLNGITNDAIIEATNIVGYQLNWKPETRAKVIREKGERYFDMLILSEGKTVISNDDYAKVLAQVEALKTSDATRWYFQDDNPFDDVERLYQLKFKGEYNGIPMRVMMDEVIVDHKNKTIIPIDLKTMYPPEWEFPESFIKWRYDIESQTYVYCLKYNMLQDEYFKDFKVLNYRFVVVNKDTLTPLVWEFKNTFSDVDLVLGDNILTNWRKIQAELTHYLNDSPKVPDGISMTEPNSIEDYFKK